MSDFLQFKPAQYFQGKDCYVGYYVINPFTKKMVRKKIKLNHISSARERKRYGTRLAFEINTKLYDGWNPFLEDTRTVPMLTQLSLPIWRISPSIGIAGLRVGRL